MRKQLFKELGIQTLWSILIYVVLFLVLYGVEWLYPSLRGELLHFVEGNGAWDWSFIVGIPASVLGTAYVLTVRNPQNYTGFYLGIVMSLLLALQLYLRGNWDLVILYVFFFTPFQIASLLVWRRKLMHKEQDAPFTPKFLEMRHAILVQLTGLAIVAIDYVVATQWIFHDHWFDQITLKIAGGGIITTALLANFLMIYKKNDAWICWVLYAISGIVQFVILGHWFSIVMFTMMLVINLSAQRAWIAQTASKDFGWLKWLRHKND